MHYYVSGDFKRAKFYHADVYCQSLASSKAMTRVHEAPTTTLCSKCRPMTVLEDVNSVVVDRSGCGGSRDRSGCGGSR